MTNFEKIKQVSVEEFAKEMRDGFRCDYCIYKNIDNGMCMSYCACVEGFIEWLNSEVKE